METAKKKQKNNHLASFAVFKHGECLEQDALNQPSRFTNLDESIQSVCYDSFCLGDVSYGRGASSYVLASY